MTLFRQRSAWRSLLSTALAFGLCCVPLQAQEITHYEAAFRAARTTAWNAIVKGQGSGVSIAIMDKGKLVFSEGMGVRDRALNNPVDSHTRFNIGSTSKMFTAVAILMLVDEGKVSLDDPVAKYISEFTMRDERYKDITVGMLLNHSSGLPGTSFLVSFAPQENVRKVLLETLARDHLKHAPGADSMYCNDGFTLAEILVERVSGLAFMDFLQQRVFQPLGLRDTGVSLGELSDDINRAEAYEAKSDRKIPNETLQIYGAGGLSSTVEDLCRFGDSFTPFGKKILSDSSLNKLRTATLTPFGTQLRNPPLFCSLGWDFSDLSPYGRQGLQVMAKGGNTNFYSANLQIIPDEGLVVALLISGQAGGESLTRPILQELLDQRGLSKKVSDPVTKPALAQKIPAEFDLYEGLYVGEASGPLELRISEDRMSLNIIPLKTQGDADSDPATPLLTCSYSEGFFFEPNSKTSLYFTTIDGSRLLVTKPSRGSHNAATLYDVDWLSYQELKQLENPLTLLQDDGKPWLVRNMPVWAIVDTAPFSVSPITYAGLEGYLDFSGLKKIESASYASVAATHFRDQTELELWEERGTAWARTSNLHYSHTAPAQSRTGQNTVLIGSEGYNEWLELHEDAIVKVSKSGGGRVVMFDPGRKVLFDSVLDDDDLFAPKGSLVFCAGPAGSKFLVSLK